MLGCPASVRTPLGGGTEPIPVRSRTRTTSTGTEPPPLYEGPFIGICSPNDHQVAALS
jgi:hypothetical protein